MVRRVHTRRSRRAGVARRDDAGEHVGVPREVLRGALPGEVGAEVERPLQERRRERAVAAQERAAGMRVARCAGDVREREQWIGRSLDDRERGAVAGAAEAVAIAGVEAPHLHAEALQDPGREALEAVVAAGRQCQGAALVRGATGRCTSRPSCRSRRLSPRRLRVRPAAPRPRPLRARARVRRASLRPARARTSSSDRAQARAHPRGCRRDRGRAGSRAPWPASIPVRVRR